MLPATIISEKIREDLFMVLKIGETDYGRGAEAQIESAQRSVHHRRRQWERRGRGGLEQS
jgi:hypothetical protein